MNLKHLALALCLIVFSNLKSQVFDEVNTLYSDNGFSGWYTENHYSPIDSYNGNIYFVMLDDTRRPYIGKITNGNTVLSPLDDIYPDYKPADDGHQEFSIGIDKDGYIHVTGDQHNFPQAFVDHVPEAYQTANILYWKSKNPEDISAFEFKGNSTQETIPGLGKTYGRFMTDRNGVMYYVSRTLARKNYWQNGGRGLGLYVYDEINKSWTARGVDAPVSDASNPVIAWEESGQNGGSYQQFKADIQFDKKNRLHIVTGMNTENGSAQVNSAIYAYSDDGGVTFHKADDNEITLPMQVASGSRQADVIDSDPIGTFEQPSMTYAFDGNPVVHYTKNGSSYYKYWTGSVWSAAKNSPVGTRGRVIYNEHESTLYFIHIHSGTMYARKSFDGNDETFDAGETFRYYDMRTFREKNELNGISWKTSSGAFKVIQLVGSSAVSDCSGEPNGAATIDNCGICSGGNTGINACVSEVQAEEACLYDGIVESLNSGYREDGYVNTDNLLGASVTWTVSSSEVTVAQLNFRYSNSSINSRVASLFVNGINISSSLSFETTGAWTNWGVLSISSASLKQGNNTIELRAEIEEGLPNIDMFTSDKSLALPTCVTGSEGLIIRNTVVYPNPFKSIVNIICSATDDVLITVFDLYGKELSSYKNVNQLDLSSFNSGMYIIRLSGDANDEFKVVKQ